MSLAVLVLAGLGSICMLFSPLWLMVCLELVRVCFQSGSIGPSTNIACGFMARGKTFAVSKDVSDLLPGPLLEAMRLPAGEVVFEALDDVFWRDEMHASRQAVDHVDAQVLRGILGVAVAQGHDP